MPIVPLAQMRDLLLPGLWQYEASYSLLSQWEELFPAAAIVRETIPAVPLGPRAALALGAAAAIVQNPEVTRRWFGWLLDRRKSCR